MPATRYKIWHWAGPARTDGTSDQYLVGVQTRAKKGTPSNAPFTVPNELIGCQLGRALGLPIPAGAIIERDGEAYYASLDFNVEGQRLPPANEAALARERPDLACGILLFDAWILNNDRHRWNLSFNPSTKSVFLYDHGKAFFGPNGRDGLLSAKGQLGFNCHCLADEVQSLAYLWEWSGRINELPKFLIRQTIEEASKVGLPKAEVNFCADYLIERRRMLLGLFAKHRYMFPNVSPAFWDQFDTEAEDYCI